MSAAQFATTKRSSVFFVPNILDYCRILLLILVMCFFTRHVWLAIWLYVLSSILDMLDGALARLLNQRSKLGTLLDFSIDRASIALLFAGCILTMPQFDGLFVPVMALDIASHFAICYVSAWSTGSHLNFIAQGSKLLRCFSLKSWVRYFICSSHDIFFAVFIGNYLVPSKYWLILWILLAPGMLCKTWIHLEQFYLAAKFAAVLD